MGDHTAVARLSAAAEREYEPRFFGDSDEKFGWWFKLQDKYPRGQRSALMMVSEIGDGGDWSGAFQASHTDKFNAPTVEDVDFPSLGVYQAWNDIKSGTLYDGKYPASPDRQGMKTSWRVTGIPNTKETVVLCDGQPFKQYEVEGPGTIRIDTTIDKRRFHIYTSYRKAVPRDDVRRQKKTDNSPAVPSAKYSTESSPVTSETISDFGPSCPCCL